MVFPWKKAFRICGIATVSALVMLSAFVSGFLVSGFKQAESVTREVVRGNLYIGLAADLNHLTEDSAQLIIAYDIDRWVALDRIVAIATNGSFSLNGKQLGNTVLFDPNRRYIDIITYHFPEQDSPLGSDQIIVIFDRRGVTFTEKVDFTWFRVD